MELNKEAAAAAQVAFDAALARIEGQPTTLQRIGAVNEALMAYEAVRLAAAHASQQEVSCAILPDDRIVELWDAQWRWHGHEPCKMGHVEFAHEVGKEVERLCRAQRTNEGKPDQEVTLESLPRNLLDEIAGLYCPSASGFEGPETYPDCGECVVCRARKIIKSTPP